MGRGSGHDTHSGLKSNKLKPGGQFSNLLFQLENAFNFISLTWLVWKIKKIIMSPFSFWGLKRTQNTWLLLQFIPQCNRSVILVIIAISLLYYEILIFSHWYRYKSLSVCYVGCKSLCSRCFQHKVRSFLPTKHAQKYYLLDRNIDDYKQEYSIIVCNVLALLTLFSTWKSDSGLENA